MKLKKLLEEIGFKKAQELGEWNGNKVFIAISDPVLCVGLPQFILEFEKEYRWASYEETMQLMEIYCV